MRKVPFVLFALGTVLLAGCSAKTPVQNQTATSSAAATEVTSTSSVKEQAGTVTLAEAAAPHLFGESVTYQAPTATINKDIAADFSTDEAANLAAIEKAYGITLSGAEQKFFHDNKFVIKNLMDTNIRPSSVGDNVREFPELYAAINGPEDYKLRKPENALFYSSDVFFHTYNNLYTQLLKELENRKFYPAMLDLSKTFFEEAQKKTDAASGAEKKTWMQVRNYFAVAYALLHSAGQPLTEEDYRGPDGQSLDPSKVMSDFTAMDTKVDTYDTAAAFVKTWKLDAPSEAAILADLQIVYKAGGKGTPAVLKDEYDAYTTQTDVEFEIDYTQFTPRGTYTSSSLRRAYFRGMKWYIMTPLFLKSPQLTQDAFALTQLLAENPQQLLDYNRLETAINFLIGTSDDLMPVDYLQALDSAKGKPDPEQAAMDFLVHARSPKIKDLTATYGAVGTEQTADVLLKTKGMRFFSGKFILDSYWTGMLTQGDEAPKPGYTQKLPPMASSLEVMTLLGSEYAKSQIPTLDFIKKANADAVNQALSELGTEKDSFDVAYWQSNAYNIWLWTIQSLFSWQKQNHDALPRFMQSPQWEVKTLQTASAFWTELRHATILYAKQSFAELGGGGPDSCDTRKVPPAPEAFIEPQLEAYQRLLYLAKRTDQGLKDQGDGDLENLQPLERFVALMEKVQTYVGKELANAQITEKILSKSRPDPEDPAKTCTEYFLDPEILPDGSYTYTTKSQWEDLRLGIVSGLQGSIPVPVEGPILDAKDRRAALVADVHTGQDSSYPAQILYEATGVPDVIIAAVKDANGPRATIGFTYSHYEFTKPYGGKRMTDEDWQTLFYNGTDPESAFDYTPKATWPATPSWYDSILKIR